jgi:hypothetical protein
MEKDSKNDLVQALRAGAQGTARSKAARLREIIDEVEAAKSRGLGHKQIVAILEGRGLSFTLGTFEITLHRIQKNRREREASPREKSKPRVAPDAPAPGMASAEIENAEAFAGKSAKQKREEVARKWCPDHEPLNPLLSTIIKGVTK